jgi:cytochrome c biogenesis protein CcdA
MLFGLLAGILSTLSPCVLPLVPAVLAGAVAQHRLAPLALAAGLALSFTGIGLFVATIGFSIGLDMGVFRGIAAVLLIAFGVVLMAPQLQERLALAAGPMADWTQSRFGRFSGSGVGGQFGVGLLMGAVWTPCVGPTLGAASVMAARGENLLEVAATMLAFGIGTAIPLLLLGLVSREAILRWRGNVGGAVTWIKAALGGLLIVTGALILTGLDRPIQVALEGALPEWLLSLTTQI